MRSKALFLLILFLLNQVVSIACALHEQLDLHTVAKKAHSHAAGHDHDSSGHSHSKHSHHEKHGDGTNKQKLSKTENDEGCCKDEVAKFNSIVKEKPPVQKSLPQLPMFEVERYFFAYYPVVLQSTKPADYFSNRQRPPNYDIRTIIQSFQV